MELAFFLIIHTETPYHKSPFGANLFSRAALFNYRGSVNTTNKIHEIPENMVDGGSGINAVSINTIGWQVV